MTATTATTTRRYGFYTKAQAEAMRDSFREQGAEARLTGRWNVNGGAVRVTFTAGQDADAMEATARAAVLASANLASAKGEAVAGSPPATANDARRLAAEYVILEAFDAKRRRAGHDYGNGQRGAELRRRERELERRAVRPLSLTLHVAEGDRDVDLTSDELAEAFERVGRPRLERLADEGYRSQTPATTRTRETWEAIGRRFVPVTGGAPTVDELAPSELPARVVAEAELERWTRVESLDELEPGDRVAVYSRGRTREALVEKIGRTNATVVYTTEGALADAVKIAGWTTEAKIEEELAAAVKRADEWGAVAAGKADDEAIELGNGGRTSGRGARSREVDARERAALQAERLELFRAGDRQAFVDTFVTVTRKSVKPAALFRPARVAGGEPTPGELDDVRGRFVPLIGGEPTIEELEEQYAATSDDARRDVVALRAVAGAIERGRYTSHDLDELFARVLAVRKAFASDTLTPQRLRDKVQHVVELIRELRDPATAADAKARIAAGELARADYVGRVGTIRLADGDAPIGSRVETHRFGAGQPQIRGTLVNGSGGEVTIELDDGTRRRRSAGNVRRDQALERIAARVEAGELVSDKSMSDRDFLAPILEERPAADVIAELVDLEEKATGELRLEAIARDAGRPATFVALAAILDRARELEHRARQYGTSYAEAEELRLAVVRLARGGEAATKS